MPRPNLREVKRPTRGGRGTWKSPKSPVIWTSPKDQWIAHTTTQVITYINATLLTTKELITKVAYKPAQTKHSGGKIQVHPIHHMQSAGGRSLVVLGFLFFRVLSCSMIKSSKSEHNNRARKLHPSIIRMTCIYGYLNGRHILVNLHRAKFLSNTSTKFQSS